MLYWRLSMQKNKFKFIFVNFLLFILLSSQVIYSKDSYNDYLINAVKTNNFSDVVKYVNKENVNIADENGKTPLSYAIEKQNINIIKILLKNGANAEIIDINTKKPLYCSQKIEKNKKLKNLFKKYDKSKCGKGYSNLFNLKTIGGALLVGGIVALSAGGGGGGNNGGDDKNDNDNNNQNNSPIIDITKGNGNNAVFDTNYNQVGTVNNTSLNNILNSGGYSFSGNFDGTTFSNKDDYDTIRLAYAWARGYTGKVSTNLTPNNGKRYYKNNSYNTNDRIKIAVVDEGVFSNHLGLSGSIITTTNNNANQLYNFYYNNAVNRYYNLGDNKAIKCSYNTNKINCDFYTKLYNTYIKISGSNFSLTKGDVMPSNVESQHGTNIASIIVGKQFDMHGINVGASGIAPDAIVLPYLIAASYNVSGKNISVFADDKYIADAFLDAAKKEAVAINNSWGISMNWYNKNNISSDWDLRYDDQEKKIYYNYGSYYGEKAIDISTFENQYGKYFLNSMKDVVNKYDSIFVFAVGNDGQVGPDLEALIPLYLKNNDGSYTFYDKNTDFYKNFIVVTAYDTENQKIADWSNRCGVAKNYCLTAPGVNLIMDQINDDKTSSTLVAVSGSSFSAPIVTGAIAVLKGAYPYLTGADITRLLFITARDLGTTGVDEVYGWGMLDLERATRPVGDTLVPVDTSVFKLKNFSTTDSGVSLSSKISNNIKNLNLSFAFFDSFNRPFMTNLNDYIGIEKNRLDTIDVVKNFATKSSNKIALNKNQSSNFYFSNSVVENHNYQELEFSKEINNLEDNNYGFNFYFGNNPYNAFIDKNTNFYNNYSLSKSYNYNIVNPYFKTNSDYNFATNNIFKLNDNLSLNFGALYQKYTMNYEKKYKNEISNDEIGDAFSIINGIIYAPKNFISSKIEFGILNEKDTLLGSKMDGAFNIGKNNITYLINLQNDFKIGEKFSIFTKANFGWTKVNTNTMSLIKDVSTIYSNSFGFGANYNFKNSNMSLLITQPVQIKSGNIKMNLPVGRDYDGNIYYQNHKIDLKSDKEINYQLAFNKNISEDSSFNLGFIFRDYIKNESIFLLKYNKLFSF